MNKVQIKLNNGDLFLIEELKSITYGKTGFPDKKIEKDFQKFNLNEAQSNIIFEGKTTLVTRPKDIIYVLFS
ncbi:hypothetical protein ACQW5G_01325 [Fructilactobacillus sp. Tb1]|uniref:hypothetical protein n=1 Tax=Fructilactobacillus sp. Tb1 TaxID=3422304 RepID=UPI003D2BE482